MLLIKRFPYKKKTAFQIVEVGKGVIFVFCLLWFRFERCFIVLWIDTYGPCDFIATTTHTAPDSITFPWDIPPAIVLFHPTNVAFIHLSFLLDSQVRSRVVVCWQSTVAVAVNVVSLYADIIQKSLQFLFLFRPFWKLKSCRNQVITCI